MKSTNFYFNNKSSKEYGVSLVHIERGMQDTPFLAEKEIISETIRGVDIPYVYDTKRRPLVFNLTLSTLEDLWTIEKRREIARWLSGDTFEEFASEDDINKKYYLQYIGGIDLTHNANEQGYIVVQMQNISPYAYSPFSIKQYDLSTITSPTIIQFVNNGDNMLYPEMWLYSIEAGDISIKNISNKGKEFKFTNILDGEELYIDNRPQFHHIETSESNTYRYDNFNGNYLEILPYSVTKLEVDSPCRIKFRYQFEIKG